MSSGFTIDYLFYEADLTFFELFSIFVAPFMIILLDHLRLRYVQVSQLILTFKNSEKIVFNGDPPESGLSAITNVFFVFGLGLIGLFFMGWVIEEVQLIGDVIAYFCAGVIILAPLFCDIFSFLCQRISQS